MTLIVRNLSKKFGQKTVVSGLNFSIQPGQIMGLLGNNGAGKSTTMRMLTGYWPPSSGQVQICGYDLQTRPTAAKKRLGYLPEHNPLYPSMYVYEYLNFMGRLHGMSAKACKEGIATVVEQCSLGDVQNKKIGILSKGYRQRIGLAQALLHNPPVLILDEPTAGLDPHQLQQIRSLLKALSPEKAILFSTHIIQEVEAICDQLIMLHQGKVCFSAPLAETARQAQLIVTFHTPPSSHSLEAIPAVEKVETLSPTQYKLYIGPGNDPYETIFSFVKQQGLTVQRLSQKKESLEDIFIRLTQAHPDALLEEHAAAIKVDAY
jgi:ABC-2 type transport system ATP-binding protein